MPVRSRRQLLIVGVGLVLAVAAVYGLVSGPAAAPKDEPGRAAIPVAPPAAKGAEPALGTNEVAAAYHAWLTGDAESKVLFREIVRKSGGRVAPGLPEYAELLVAAAATGVLVRGAVREAGTILADGETGAILSWTLQGMRGLGGDGFGALLFEEMSSERSVAFDGKNKRMLGEIAGAPLAASSDGSVIVYAAPPDEDSSDPGTIVRVWSTREGRDRRTLRVAADAASPPALGTPSFGEVAVVSDDGRYVAALVEDETARFVVWDVASGRIVASQTLARQELAARFSADGKSLYALTAAPARPGEDAREGLARVRLDDGVVEGPFFSCNTSHTPVNLRTIALSADGKLVALGGTEDACVFHAVPLKPLWKTPVLRKTGPIDDDLGGTYPTFVLGDRALLVGSEGPPSWALFRTSDQAELARGAVFADPRDAAPVTTLVSPGRVVLMLEAEAGPIVVDVDATATAKTRELTRDEQDGEVQPPELAAAPAAGTDPQAREDRARLAIGKRVCHAGDIVIPIEMCP